MTGQELFTAMSKESGEVGTLHEWLQLPTAVRRSYNEQATRLMLEAGKVPKEPYRHPFLNTDSRDL